jgi:hypothetical protein
MISESFDTVSDKTIYFLYLGVLESTVTAVGNNVQCCRFWFDVYFMDGRLQIKGCEGIVTAVCGTRNQNVGQYHRQDFP